MPSKAFSCNNFLKRVAVYPLMRYVSLLLIVLLAPLAAAQSGSMPLLAVSELENGTLKGSMASLRLDVERGSNRVFLETYPASKLDTQFSTRFAKKVACAYTEESCGDKNFFYSIKAGSSIIGGPSAGAASTILTIGLLKDLDLDEDVVITGTINSGGIIGTVGGIKEKIDISAESGYEKVLIPFNTRQATVENASLDLIEYGRQINVTVVEVATLAEAMRHFTDRRIFEDTEEIEIGESYKETMDLLAAEMCARSNHLQERVANITAVNESTSNRTAKGVAAYEDARFYSAASYCFGSNIQYTSTLLKERNLSGEEIRQNIRDVGERIATKQTELADYHPKTMTELQTLGTVKSRLRDAETSLETTYDLLENESEGVLNSLAYTIERHNSAISWSQFLGTGGRRINLDQEVLSQSCLTRMTEAAEHLQYVTFLYGTGFGGLQERLNTVRELQSEKEYISCLYEASLVKARTNVLMSAAGVNESRIANLTRLKLDAAKRAIARQQEEGQFPIVGYSYYEYANSLLDEDPASALLYAEFALELSDLDIYLPSESQDYFIPRETMVVFSWGFILGLLCAALYYVLFIRKEKGRQT